MYRTWSGVPQRRNENTCVDPDTGRSQLPLTKQELLERAYRAIAVCAATSVSPAVIATAVDLYSGNVHGCRALPIGGKATRIVLGRHSQCDLLLPESANISLRHLLIVAGAPGGATYRVIDLRSATEGFVDDNQRRHRALLARGGTFLRIDRVGIFLLPVERDMAHDMPRPNAEALFPRPEYVEEQEPVGLPVHEVYDGRTRVTPVAGPDWCRSAEGERAFSLRVKTRGRSFAIALDREALTRGVLLGNYPRCDSGFLHPDVSRVHALVQLLAGVPHVIDTASTNATRIAGVDVDIAVLAQGARFSLGGASEVEWRELWSSTS